MPLDSPLDGDGRLMKRLAKLFVLVPAAAFGIASAHEEGDSVRRLSLVGQGKFVDQGAPGCEIEPGSCTVKAEGSVSGLPGGKAGFEAVLTVLWKQATPNAAEGLCAPLSGQITITARDDSSIVLDQVGTLCEVGPTGAGIPHTFGTTYFWRSATGRFAGFASSGSLTGSEDGSNGGFGNVLFNLNGAITRRMRE